MLAPDAWALPFWRSEMLLHQSSSYYPHIFGVKQSNGTNQTRNGKYNMVVSKLEVPISKLVARW